jgi:hypothetical protein
MGGLITGGTLLSECLRRPVIASHKLLANRNINIPIGIFIQPLLDPCGTFSFGLATGLVSFTEGTGDEGDWLFWVVDGLEEGLEELLLGVDCRDEPLADVTGQDELYWHFPKVDDP